MFVFLILMVVTCCLGEPQISFNTKIQPPKAGRRVEPPNVKCVCYKKAGPTVADALQEDQKRLAVYLYKDANDNLNMYIPNKEKQELLPDLGLEKGDVFAIVSSEPVRQLFDSNNAINLKTSSPGKPIITNASPNIEHSFTSQVAPYIPDEENASPHIHYADVDDHRTPEDSNNVQFGVSEAIFAVPTISGHYTSEYTDSLNNQKQKETLSNMEDSQNLDSLSELNEKPGPNSLPSLDSIVNNDDAESSVDAEVVPPPSGSDVENRIQATKPEQDKIYDNLNLPEGPSEDLDTQDESILSENENSSIYDHNEPLGVENPKNPNSISESESESDSNLVHPDKTTESNPGVEPISEKGHATFDHWFAQQMQKIHNTGQSPKNNFELSSLKQLIEKTLYENGMYVTKDGVLIDSKGEALDVANLKLRPILIGDSMAYNSIFSVTGGNKFELPSNMPYLEAVLVTLVNPPKILGVIPLGKTYVPRVSYRRTFDYWNKNARPRTACKIGKCSQQKGHTVQFRSQNSPRSVRQERPLIIKKYNPSPISSNVQNMQGYSSYKHGKKAYQPVLFRKRKFDLDNLLKVLFSPDKKKVGFKAPSKKKPESVQQEDLYEEVTVLEDAVDEIPWYRIIGGNPATSSGTPVSSKGRSGREYY